MIKDFGDNDFLSDAEGLTDGKIVAIGYSDPETFMVRYEKDGSLDSSFGDEGLVIIETNPAKLRLSDLEVQPNGKYLISSSGRKGNKFSFIVLRLNTNGTLDLDFGENGYVWKAPGDFKVKGDGLIKYTEEGKILIAQVLTSDRKYVAVLRYEENGVLDETFGNDGLALFPVKGECKLGRMLLDPKGNIIVAGGVKDGTLEHPVIIKYTPSGKIDETFGEQGVVDWLPFGASNGLFGVDEAGLLYLSGGTDYSVVRLTKKGKVDLSYGRSFKRAAIFEEIALVPGQLFPDGRILFAGYGLQHYPKFYGLVMFDSEGFVDKSFGLDGVIKVTYSYESFLPLGFRVLADDQILLSAQIKEYDHPSDLDIYFAKLRNVGTTVPEVFEEHGVEVFPNPTSGNTRVVVSFDKATEIDIVVYNNQGQRIWNGYLNNKQEIPSADWPKGMYWISIVSEGQRAVKKLIKY